jgi:hypothetical protein
LLYAEVKGWISFAEERVTIVVAPSAPAAEDRYRKTGSRRVNVRFVGNTECMVRRCVASEK